MFDIDVLRLPYRQLLVEHALREWLDQVFRPSVGLAAEVGARTSPSAAVRDARLTAFRAELDAGGARLTEARLAQRSLDRAAAERARALAGFARSRPSSADRSDQEVGAAAAASRAARPRALLSVSEWAVDEVSAALRLTSDAATRLLVESVLLVEELPATLAALEEGRISQQHAAVLVDLLAPLDAGVRAVAEERLLARAGGKTAAQLRAAARRLVQRLDPDALADRVERAIRDRRVGLHAGEDGMSTLYALLPAPVARACHDALSQYADASRVEGDTRSKDQRMADCLVDLVLRPGQHGMAPVQARLVVVAAVETLLGGPEPGEVSGDLVPAVMVRELAYALGLLPRPTDDQQEPGRPAPSAVPTDATPATIVDDTAPPAAEGHPETEAVTAAPAVESHPETGAVTAPPAVESRLDTEAVTALGALLGTRRTEGTALASRPEIAVVDGLSGQLLALTDATEIRQIAGGSSRAVAGDPSAAVAAPPVGEPGSRPPPPTPGYRPHAALERFVHLRDRRCRFPGCRARPVSCDGHHIEAWPAGPTSSSNLCSLCRHHHRLVHQAPGWRLRALDGHGTLVWSMPDGTELTTQPPRFGTDDDLPRITQPAGATTVALAARPTLVGRPSPPGLDADPPPF
ncbi:HNH endonuclease signature motif containing protein [Goekera deserti]|uniref:DUF222 domain-containing protein n=1 Tax=Goekera deserti TaxID=2497753 RepID=A0A7K3W917_9ACTN|nr:HNH endonuclease signature motif containing protein [Goekera deserti]NDI49214.1 DUF222 domain-containing protein [Goekera deserti]NEL52952.1 DUF222 domain-containing protein [Goekera deserti]